MGASELFQCTWLKAIPILVELYTVEYKEISHEIKFIQGGKTRH